MSGLHLIKLINPFATREIILHFGAFTALFIFFLFIILLSLVQDKAFIGSFKICQFSDGQLDVGTQPGICTELEDEHF